jgi:hypothetical protein
MTTEEDSATASKTEAMKIPAFLNCTLTAKANTVLYDNLTLKMSQKTNRQRRRANNGKYKSSIFYGQRLNCRFPKGKTLL